MATELGSAYVQIIPSAKGISTNISKVLNEGSPGVTASGSFLGGKLALALKGAIAVAGISKFIGKSLTEGGELQQSLGGVETLFKEHANTIKEYANNAYKTVGISANEYMQNITRFSASLLQSTSGDTKKSADIANMAMIDMADNANKLGTSIELIQNAYQGFAKQNYMMLDNLSLGYGGTKKEMERLLADAGKISGIKYDISSFADISEAIHIIQKEMGITGTTAKEATETFHGSMLSMTSSFKNVIGKLSIGTDITKDIKALGETTSVFLFNNLIPMIANIFKALPSAIGSFFNSAVPYFVKGGVNLIKGLTEGASSQYETFINTSKTFINSLVKSLPSAIGGLGDILSSIIGFIMQNAPLLINSGKDILLNLLTGITDNLPMIGDSLISVVNKIIGTILENAPQFVKSGLEIIFSLAKGLLLNLPQIISATMLIIAKLIFTIISKLPDILNMGGEIIKTLAQGGIESSKVAINMAKNIIDEIYSEIKSTLSKFYQAGKNIISSIADGIYNSISVVTNAISSVTSAVRDFLPFSPAKTGPLKDLNKLDFGIIADGIYNAERPIIKAMDYITKSTLDSFNNKELKTALNSNVVGSFDFRHSNNQGKGGDLVINIENVNNSSDRNIEDFAKEMGFYYERKKIL